MPEIVVVSRNGRTFREVVEGDFVIESRDVTPQIRPSESSPLPTGVEMTAALRDLAVEQIASFGPVVGDKNILVQMNQDSEALQAFNDPAAVAEREVAFKKAERDYAIAQAKIAGLAALASVVFFFKKLVLLAKNLLGL